MQRQQHGREHAARRVSRTRTGTLSSPSPGSSITMVPMRANTSMKVAASAGRNEMSIAWQHSHCVPGRSASHAADGP